MNKRVVIIDDEKAARNNLKDVIQSFASLSVIAELCDGKSAIEQIPQLQPDIVFLDIEMPEVNGFEVAKATQHCNYQLVFVTAYDHYALSAFETQAISYLLKPVRPQLIRQCIEKILYQENINLEKYTNNSPVPHQAKPKKHTLTLSDGISNHIIDVHYISFIESLGRYRRIHFNQEGRDTHQIPTILTDKTLDAFMYHLPNPLFMRLHRSYIINMSHIISHHVKIRRHFVILKDIEQPIPVSRSQVPFLKQQFIP